VKKEGNVWSVYWDSPNSDYKYLVSFTNKGKEVKITKITKH